VPPNFMTKRAMINPLYDETQITRVLSQVPILYFILAKSGR
jgi:hypothetical protein